MYTLFSRSTLTQPKHLKPKPAKMVYTNWTTKVDVVSKGSWASVEMLYCFVNEVSGLDIGKNDVREEIFAKLNAICIEAPFSKDERFPEEKCYVDLHYGDLPWKLQKIRKVCCYKYPKGVDRRHYSEFSNALITIVTLIRQSLGVFDRGQFESYYGITWK